MVIVWIFAVLLILYLVLLLLLRCRKGNETWAKLKPQRYAHRGYHDKPTIPENSMPAFRRAIEHGWGAELDVHLLRDGTLAVFHDSDLKRCANVEGQIEDLDLEGLRKLGDPNAFAKEYYEAGIDELLYIDIVASLYNRNNLSDIVRKTVDDVYIPVCVGGGLRSVEDVRHILSMGADKAAINTAAIKRPELITEVAEAFGSQCMVLSIQAKRSRTWPGKWEAYYDNGRAHSGYDVVEWAKRGVALGAGEILLTSVDNEGLQQGMDLELIEAVTKAVNVPVICGGGVGCGDDIVDAANAGADAVACAAVLHYKKETVQELKDDIRAGGVEVRRV